MSSYNYYGSGRSSRASHHTGGDSHNGSFEQGRIILPSLTEAFPTSNSPGSSFHVTQTYVPVNSNPLNTVSGSYPSPHPPQQYPTYPQFRACLTVGKPSLSVLTPNAKTHLPSSKLKLDTASLITIQVNTRSLPTLGYQAVVVRRTTTIDPHTRQTIGASRHCH